MTDSATAPAYLKENGRCQCSRHTPTSGEIAAGEDEASSLEKTMELDRSPELKLTRTFLNKKWGLQELSKIRSRDYKNFLK